MYIEPEKLPNGKCTGMVGHIMSCIAAIQQFEKLHDETSQKQLQINTRSEYVRNGMFFVE